AGHEPEHGAVCHPFRYVGHARPEFYEQVAFGVVDARRAPIATLTRRAVPGPLSIRGISARANGTGSASEDNEEQNESETPVHVSPSLLQLRGHWAVGREEYSIPN